MRKLVVALVILFLASPGCIANMRDLQERLGVVDEPVERADVEVPEPLPPEPPVAQMRIEGPAGAVHAGGPEDSLVPNRIERGLPLMLVAAPVPNATAYMWRVGNTTQEGERANLTLEDAGLHPIVLHVTNPAGSDEQTVVLAIAPEPVTVETPFVMEAVAGVQEVGQKGVASFTLALGDAPVPDAKVVAFVVTLQAPANCDLALDVRDPTETSLGKVDKAGAGEAETRTLEAPFREGEYGIEALPVACAATEGVGGSVAVTFLQAVPGLDAPADDGHGGHAH